MSKQGFFSPVLRLLERVLPSGCTSKTLLHNAIDSISSLSFSYILWKLLGIAAYFHAPIVVVLTESMTPGFRPGDVLFLRSKQYKLGDIAVFMSEHSKIPIVHRIVKISDGRIMTKGDNNISDDRWLYGGGREFLTPKDIESVVVAYLPYFGHVRILLGKFLELRPVIIIATLLIPILFGSEYSI